MDLVEQLLDTWRRHDAILHTLLDGIPRGGLKALPAESRGRDVSRQFAHLARVREGWVYFHETGERPDIPGFDKGKGPTKVELRKMLKTTSKLVEQFLEQALRGEARTRQFGRSPVRWLGYLISHESHHRGQIALALKQSGLQLPEEVSREGLWGRWIMGK